MYFFRLPLTFVAIAVQKSLNIRPRFQSIDELFQSRVLVEALLTIIGQTLIMTHLVYDHVCVSEHVSQYERTLIR